MICDMNFNKTMRCWLVAVDQSHEDIELPDGVPVSIGRSTTTNIADTQVSRLHGVVIASFIVYISYCSVRCINYCITGNSNNSLLLGGDFNFPGWDWMAGSIKPKSQYPSLHQKFGDIINDNGLAQVVQEPTRQGNVLDLIVSNKPNQVNRIQILPGIGDHNAVFCDFDENKLHVGLPFTTQLTGLVSGCLSLILVKRSIMPLVGVRTLRFFDV